LGCHTGPPADVACWTNTTTPMPELTIYPSEGLRIWLMNCTLIVRMPWRGGGGGGGEGWVFVFV